MAFLRRNKSADKEHSGDDGNPFTQRGFVVATAGFGILCLAAVTVIVFEPDGLPSTPQARAASASTSPVASSAAVPPGSGGEKSSTNTTKQCPELSDRDQTIPTVQPAGVVWEPYHGVGLPVSRVAGPGLADSGTVRCYARTPVGALIAAAQASERYETAESPILVAGTMLAQGPGKESFLARSRSATSTRTADQGQSVQDKPQFVGFRVDSYSPQASTVTLVRMREKAGTFDATTWTVVWDEGWRLQLPPDGSRPPARSVSTTAGYVAWTP
ncbi:hypothetical protein OG948_32865 [Embleya sp. NBC_00888]|uniref:hypothetical protein n=1 Tax=Embleya sp. NBC_00888 TaxID=2975960 RepID=UPI00386630F5|nr:hypothetical protein OG948_32865 [Embleya sp. NBC_00888]